MNLGSFLNSQDNSPPLPWLALIVIVGLYLLVGVTGHDPWKTEDAIHISIAYGFAQHGHWLTPAIAGEAWPHTAPLYHWVAALFGRLLGGWLPFHDAARLATTFFGAFFLLLLSGTARSFHGDASGRIAPLLGVGTLGLLLPMHEAQPAIAGLACATLAWRGGGLSLQGNPWGAPMLGFGLGLAFLAHGLVGLIMALAVLPAPILRRDWKGLALALLVALPLITSWPWLLMQHAPEFWTQWWQNEFAEATQGRKLPVPRHLEQLAWAVWPIWPIALWSIWLHRHGIDKLLLPILGAVLTLAWFLSGPPRSLAVLTVFIPLILIAASGADHLRRGAANAFDWFGLMTFTFVAVLIWLGASAQIFDWPPKLANNFDKLAPGHTVEYSVLALTMAISVSAIWLLSWGLRRTKWRATLRWATGITLIWMLTTLLWMPWIDYAISYRPVVQSLKAALPQTADCIERVDIGISQRASLDYFGGIRTVAPLPLKPCDWRLSIDHKQRTAPAGWIEIWRGGRTSDRKERWYLDRRETKSSESSPGST